MTCAVKRKHYILGFIIVAVAVVIAFRSSGADEIGVRAASLAVGATKDEVCRLLGAPRDTIPAGGCFTPFEEWHYGGRWRFDVSGGWSSLFTRGRSDAIVHFGTNGRVVLVLIPDRNEE
jgi:hypothetical protein